MTDVLSRILEHKRREVAEAKARVSERELRRRLAEAPARRDFRAAISAPGPIHVIAEVKRASPSAGVIRSDFDPVAIAQTYERHGASAISVLTDEAFFQGSLEHLVAVRREVSLPVLRKEFIIDPYQLMEARVAGADAILLIAEALDAGLLRSLLRQTWDLGLEALVELHDSVHLSWVLDSGARIIGINNRDLRTFTTRLEHTLELLPRVPPSVTVVSESGIRTRDDVLRLQAAGVRAILVGESLMRAGDIGAQLDQLRGL
ncbi:MAG: indole-3-glycerol phosphate synthase TrpC [Gemmataceae bacterium]|nr:indole-3-glycerol phosphate synthase TrpC [Gemmataceae bacterium]MDW8264455.1 indole-3-glycerol phosphate synthase TrpC [Gemmataceae bacterium]